MQDLSYVAALEQAPEPHVVLLGPAPCQGCGAWVEWAGLAWLALGTREAHRCEPYTKGQRTRLNMAHEIKPRTMVAAVGPVGEPTDLHQWRDQLVLAVVAVLVLVLVAAGWRPM